MSLYPKMFALVLAAGLQQPQLPHVSLISENSALEITADTITGSILGVGKFSASGRPVLIELPHMGMQLKASRVEGESMKNGSGQYQVASADLVGNPLLTIDSVKMAAFLHQPPMADVKASFHSSNAMTYRDVNGEAHLHIDTSFQGVLDFVQAGPAPTQSTHVDLTGGTSDFTLVPSAPDSHDIVQSGDIAGPVKISCRITQQAPQENLNFHVDSDRAEIRLKGSNRSIKLIGNVRVKGDGLAYVGNATGEQLILTLGPANELKEVTLTGSPAKVETKPPKGGGR